MPGRLCWQWKASRHLPHFFAHAAEHGLIAAIRRVLILTAEFSKPAEISQAAFHNVMFELGLLTVLILALVFSLFLLKRQHIATADHA